MTENILSAWNDNRQKPQLLVSVRSTHEATLALSGGCQILDVKDPSRGSLGRADNDVVEEILSAGLSSEIPVSAAMGEVSDYETSQKAERNLRLTASLSKLSFVKLGMAGLKDDRSWPARWQDAMSFLTDSAGPSDGTRSPDWVAVIYADWQAANAPSPNEIVDCVLSSREPTSNQIAGILVDTWSKNSGRLLDHLSAEQLSVLADSVQQSNRFFAVAGRLTSAMLPALISVRPNIVGIRSAACRQEDRTSSVDEVAVRRFRSSIDRVFSVEQSAPIGAVHE